MNAPIKMTNEQALVYARTGQVPNGTKQPDGLFMVETADDTGRKIREFTGEPLAWMSQFMKEGRQMIKLDKHCDEKEKGYKQNFMVCVPVPQDKA